MLARAVTARVAYVPGTAFFAQGSGADAGRHHLRLSYCFPSPDRITEGVRRLADVVDHELELLDTFGPGATQDLHLADQLRAPGPDLR